MLCFSFINLASLICFNNYYAVISSNDCDNTKLMKQNVQRLENKCVIMGLSYIGILFPTFLHFTSTGAKKSTYKDSLYC